MVFDGALLQRDLVLVVLSPTVSASLPVGSRPGIHYPRRCVRVLAFANVIAIGVTRWRAVWRASRATSLTSPQALVLDPLQNVAQLARPDFMLHAGVHSHVDVAVVFQPLGRS